MNGKFKILQSDAFRGWDELFAAINHVDDRVTAIVATSFVDHFLDALLRSHFIESSAVDKVLNGCLNGLSDKAHVSYCLGIIPKQDFQNIENMARIRNRFAHKIGGITFGDKVVQKLCEEISLPLLSGTKYSLMNAPLNGSAPSRDRSKARFRMIALHLCVQLSNYTASKIVPGASLEVEFINPRKQHSDETLDHN